MEARYEGKAATVLAKINGWLYRLRLENGETRVVSSRSVSVLNQGKPALRVVKNEERAQ